MTRHRVRKNTALGLAAFVAVLGFWLGEGGSPPWAVVPIVSTFVAALAIAAAVPGRLWAKVIAGVVSFALCAVALFLGWVSFTYAFDECVEKGEEVRAQLNEYQKKKGRFPERLGQLEGFRLCGRILRPTVLEYERRENGYVLSFEDWLVEHTATESKPFLASK